MKIVNIKSQLTPNEQIFKTAYKYYKIGKYKNAAGGFWLYSTKGILLKNYALYLEGISLIKLKEYKKADIVLFMLVKDYPNFSYYKTAIFYLAVAERKIGLFPSSVDHFEYTLRHSKTGPVTLRTYLMFRIALSLVKLKKYRNAKRYFLRLLVDYPIYSKKHDIKKFISLLPNGINSINLTTGQKVKLALDLYYDSKYTDSLHILSLLNYGRLSKAKLSYADIIKLKCLIKQKDPRFSDEETNFLKNRGISKIKSLDLKIRYYNQIGNGKIVLSLLNKAANEYGYLNKYELSLYKILAWKLVIKDLENGYYLPAKNAMRRLVLVDNSVSRNNAKYLFWYGVILKKLGLTSQASFYFNIIRNSFSSMYSYYGIMSGVELDKIAGKNDVISDNYIIKRFGSYKKSKLIDFAGFLPGFFESLKSRKPLLFRYNRFIVFLKMHIWNFEYAEMNSMLQKYSKIKTQFSKPDFIIALSYILSSSGNYQSSINLASRLLYQGNNSKNYKNISAIVHNLAYLRLLYPRPFYPYAVDYSKHYGTPVNLIYSIMRQESMYDPLCRSYADAIGLMQIIPPTAYYIAGKVGCYNFNPYLLYKKSISINFGSYYLKTLLNRFNDRNYLAIASYNAGPNAVAYWKYHILRNDRKLLFIERIPFGQTRNYVKRVLSNYYIYNSIY